MHSCSVLVLVLLSSIPPGNAALNATAFIYDGFSGADLTTDGEASVADGLLSLTSGQEHSKGHAFRTYPLNFTDLATFSNRGSVPSFSTTFVFSIIGQHGGLSSDGLAFVLSSTKEIFNDLPSRYLGLVDSWNHGNTSIHLLAVELDTIINPDLRDINRSHIGIDVNSLISIASREPGYYTSDGEFHYLSLLSGKPMQVWVDYDNRRTMLNVTIVPYTLLSTKPSRPMLSITYDLSSVLPITTVYAGFSSACGILAGRHYILGWSFKLNGEAASLNYSALSLDTIQGLIQQQLESRPRSNYKKTLLIVLLPTATVAILACAILVKLAHVKRRSVAGKKYELEWEMEYGPPSFTYKDLLAATNGFKDERLLGRGGFGSVYKGLLPLSKQMVAIKRVSPESKQGMREFMAEIVILGHLRHRNLVQLLGYCCHKQQLLLVYDYMPNGSLDCYLHTQENNTNVLCWDQRFRIIKGVASGLFYLHEDWEQVVIHRDIKTSNVLLDAEMNARLGDFGLARSHDHGADAHTTRMAGTWGYIAPELARLGKATKATDVFAFGVLMMEIACARRPIWMNGANGEPLPLADWVLAAWRGGSITDAVDPRLDDYKAEEMELVLKLGLLCSHSSPNVRPSMRLVMQYLQRDAPLPANLQPNGLLLSSDVLSQDEVQDDHAMSCPVTTITDLSKGR